MYFFYKNNPKYKVGIEGQSELLNILTEELYPYIEYSYESCDCNLTIVLKTGYSNQTFQKSKNYIILEYDNLDKLINLSRKIIRDFLYLKTSYKYTQLHAGLVEFNNSGILIIGPSGKGKTSTIVTLLNELKDIKFISNDRVIVNPNNLNMLGWPTSIGVGEFANNYFAINATPYKTRNKYWYNIRDFKKSNISCMDSTNCKLCIAPNFTKTKSKTTISRINTKQLLKSNIRTDFESGNNYFEEEQPVFQSSNIINQNPLFATLPSFEITTEGISGKYIDALKEVIYGNI